MSELKETLEAVVKDFPIYFHIKKKITWKILLVFI